MLSQSIFVALCFMGVGVLAVEYPCNLVDCRTGDCRLQEVNCVRSPCYPSTICSRLTRPSRYCPVGKPVLDSNKKDIRCSTNNGRSCPDGTECTGGYLGRCCWTGNVAGPSDISAF